MGVHPGTRRYLQCYPHVDGGRQALGDGVLQAGGQQARKLVDLALRDRRGCAAEAQGGGRGQAGCGRVSHPAARSRKLLKRCACMACTLTFAGLWVALVAPVLHLGHIEATETIIRFAEAREGGRGEEEGREVGGGEGEEGREVGGGGRAAAPLPRSRAAGTSAVKQISASSGRLQTPARRRARRTTK